MSLYSGVSSGRYPIFAAHRDAVVVDVVSGDLGPSGGRREEGRQDLHRRRLAGSVGAEEAENLAGTDVEGDGVDRRAVATITLRQPFDVDHHLVGHERVTPMVWASGFLAPNSAPLQAIPEMACD
jgi:hypothetical protein